MNSRPTLGTIPFALLMAGLAFLAIAIIIAAWPGRQRVQPPQPVPSQAEVGTAPKGWIDGN